MDVEAQLEDRGAEAEHQDGIFLPHTSLLYFISSSSSPENLIVGDMRQTEADVVRERRASVLTSAQCGVHTPGAFGLFAAEICECQQSFYGAMYRHVGGDAGVRQASRFKYHKYKFKVIQGQNGGQTGEAHTVLL